MAAQKTRKGSNSNAGLKPFYYILGLVAVGGGVLFATGALGGGSAATEPVDLPPEAVNNPQALVQAARGVKIGPDNAPVKILVFSDFMCPACKDFATKVEPHIKQQYGSNGQVQFVYYDFPLGGSHKYSFLASRASRCAEDQGKFWEYHDNLFVNQGEWSFSQTPPVSTFIEYAKTLGLNEGEFEGCLKSDKHAELVTANKALGDQLRVSGTPTVFMNGRYMAEWYDFELLKPKIDRELGVPAAS